MNASFGKKFCAVLATGRVTNLPTVWSNVIVAFYLAASLDLTGYGSFIADSGNNFYQWLMFFGCIATSMLYVGGCMLGDYRDIRFDTENRPGRPLVTGLLSPGFVALGAITLLVLGLLFGGLSSLVALLIAYEIPLSSITSAPADQLLMLLQITPLFLLGTLVLAIVIYALFHKKSRSLALLNMASCRALLVVFAGALSIPPDTPIHLHWLCSPLMIIAFSVGIYTLLLASVAATESNQNQIKFSRALKAGMFLLPLLAVACLAVTDAPFFPLFDRSTFPSDTISATTLRAYFIGTVLIYGSWMIYSFSALPKDKPAFVSRALAGFCLLDACFAATFSVTIPLVCFILFGLALLLQKIAPAT